MGDELDVSSVAVHPHACGEHVSLVYCIPIACGSSPRMWGTQVQSGRWENRRRFIPTHVGNTRCRPRSPAATPVHPHACGEHVYAVPSMTSVRGSSPRMWGTHDHEGGDAADTRFIPTHVGNTFCGASAVTRMSVHPHACGEHGSEAAELGETAGSSPRMWGTHAPLRPRERRIRFIPTHVGNTPPPRDRSLG